MIWCSTISMIDAAITVSLSEQALNCSVAALEFQPIEQHTHPRPRSSCAVARL